MPAQRARSDGGRTILEALIGLSLVGLAILGWTQMSTTATKAEATAAHRGVALELATNAADAIVAREWTVAVIDPALPGAVRRFEGQTVVTGPGGLAGEETIARDGRDFTIRRYILDAGDPSWRRVVVVVTWFEGQRENEVRVDSAVRAPDPGST